MPIHETQDTSFICSFSTRSTWYLLELCCCKLLLLADSVQYYDNNTSMPLSSCHFERLHCLSLSPCWPELGVQFHFYLLSTRKQWKLVMNSRKKKMKLLYLTFNLRKELSSLICISHLMITVFTLPCWKIIGKHSFQEKKVLSEC